MSEYQYVIFQAVDNPLNDKQLEFARMQSTRADVTRWNLTVEYDYSSFRGEIDGLLRHGFDIYLSYTSYGCREIKFRLPSGFPHDEEVWSVYLDDESLTLEFDKDGDDAILSLCPYHESGDLSELGEPHDYLDSAIRIRERLLSGDLRALYTLWMCAADDDYNDPEEMIEPPVPHGIADFSKYGDELLEFFGLDPLLLIAAGKDLESTPVENSRDQVLAQWVHEIDERRAKDLLLKFLIEDTTSVKASLLAEIRNSQSMPEWPTTDKQRSFGELMQEAETLRDLEIEKQARKDQLKAEKTAAEAERERVDRMKVMVKDPKRWLGEAERLVKDRGTRNYELAAEILSDLREALGDESVDDMARRHARYLTQKYPTLNYLKGSLRKRGLLP